LRNHGWLVVEGRLSVIYLIVERKKVHMRTGFLFLQLTPFFLIFYRDLKVCTSHHLFILIPFQRCDQLFWEPYSENPSGKGVEKQYVIKNLAGSQPLWAIWKGVVT
jgi:hypothetical protein